MRITILDREAPLDCASRAAFEDRARLGLGTFSSQIVQLVLQATRSTVENGRSGAGLQISAHLRSGERVVVAGEWEGDPSTLAAVTDRLCRAVRLKLQSTETASR